MVGVIQELSGLECLVVHDCRLGFVFTVWVLVVCLVGFWF